MLRLALSGVFASVLSAYAASAAPNEGEEFVYSFKPVGSDKEVTIKGLKGKVVVIDFWATWCPPCRAEMPHMKELYAKYKDKGLEIIGVSLDRAEAPLTAYVKEHSIGWLQAFGPDAQKLAKECGIRAIPTIYIIDKGGKLHSKLARGNLDKLIPELLDKKE